MDERWVEEGQNWKHKEYGTPVVVVSLTGGGEHVQLMTENGMYMEYQIDIFKDKFEEA